MTKIILFGKPMAGKGTIAKLVSKQMDIVHVSTGDLFRAEVTIGTELGNELQDYMSKGLLVPDEVTIEVLKNNLPESCLFDGFPRTVNQAKALNEITNIDLVINLECSDELIIKRTLARRICKECGAIYGISVKPKVEGKCDCGGELIQRKDDNLKTIQERLNIYNGQTFPILKYYGKLVVNVDADKMGIEPVFEDTMKVLKSKGLYNK